MKDFGMMELQRERDQHRYEKHVYKVEESRNYYRKIRKELNKK